MHPKKRLPFGEGGIAEGVDFLDSRISHREASDGNLISVNHKVLPCPVMVPIISVRIANVEGKVKAAIAVSYTHLRAHET